MAKEGLVGTKVAGYMVQLKGLLNDLERYESGFANHPLRRELVNLLEQCKAKLESSKPVDLKSDDYDVEMADVRPESELDGSLDAMVWE